MPKGVMEELDLEITKEYKDLYTFDSKQVKCVGLVKDLVVSLTVFHEELSNEHHSS